MKYLVLAPITLSMCALIVSCKSRDQPVRYHSFDASIESSVGTEIHVPSKLTSIESAKLDSLGREIRVACVTCHSLRTPERLPESAQELAQFHKGLQFSHGSLKCASCHVVGNQDSLRLAEGKLIAMKDAMQLCAQCHGTQHRSYKQGSHGGMNGYWLQTQGIRTRNHCVDCHDPHVPKFQPTLPVLPPKDRLLTPMQAGHSSHENKSITKEGQHE